MSEQNWWEATDTAKTPGLDSHFHQGWATVGLAVQALKGGDTVLSRHKTATLKDDVKAKDWIASFIAAFPNFRVIEDDGDVWITASDHGAIRFEHDDQKITANSISRSKVFDEAFRTWWKDNTVKTIPKGRVYVLITTNQGPDFKSLGVGGEDIIRENYTDEVLKGYDRVVKDLNAEEPAGRVSIFNGKPGTGKTYLIRGLLNAVKDAVMIIVPANLVVQLAQPGMIPALVQLHKNQDNKPMVFLIEDADEVLAPRMGDNMSAVSVVLNLGDGILGKLLDIRIVATTNAAHQEIDDAIKRPGRLTAAVDVGPLPHGKAQGILTRLKPDTVLKPGSHTLAEIYQQARDEGWEPPKKERKLGFGANDEDDESEDDDYDEYE